MPSTGESRKGGPFSDYEVSSSDASNFARVSALAHWCPVKTILKNVKSAILGTYDNLGALLHLKYCEVDGEMPQVSRGGLEAPSRCKDFYCCK